MDGPFNLLVKCGSGKLWEAFYLHILFLSPSIITGNLDDRCLSLLHNIFAQRQLCQHFLLQNSFIICGRWEKVPPAEGLCHNFLDPHHCGGSGNRSWWRRFLCVSQWGSRGQHFNSSKHQLQPHHGAQDEAGSHSSWCQFGWAAYLAQWAECCTDHESLHILLSVHP